MKKGNESTAANAQVYGVGPVIEALRAATRPIERIHVAEGIRDNSRLHKIVELARAANIPVRRLPRHELDRLLPGASHQGVVAYIAAAGYADAGRLIEELGRRARGQDTLAGNSSPLVLVLDGIEDPRNLGAIIRTAECAGADAVFIPERRAAQLTEAAAKTAAGAIEYVPVARVTNLARLADELKEIGIWTIGATADAPLLYTECDFLGPCALFLGSEGEGLRRLVRERCDLLVRIPLKGHTSSLNVSVAAGILLYEVLRQRNTTGVKGEITTIASGMQ